MITSNSKIIKKNIEQQYAHIEVLVTFLLVNFFGFLVIARCPRAIFHENRWKNFVQASRTFPNRSIPPQTSGRPSFQGQKIQEKIKKLMSTSGTVCEICMFSCAVLLFFNCSHQNLVFNKGRTRRIFPRKILTIFWARFFTFL